MIRAPLPAGALFIDAAPYPLNAGPFFTGAAASQRCSRGRRMRSVNRVDRSTRVPIAERPVPKPAAAGHGHAGGRWSPAWKPSGTGRTTRPSTGPPRHDIELPTPGRGIAPQFPRDRLRATPQNRSDLADTTAPGPQQGDLLPPGERAFRRQITFGDPVSEPTLDHPLVPRMPRRPHRRSPRHLPHPIRRPSRNFPDLGCCFQRLNPNKYTSVKFTESLALQGCRRPTYFSSSVGRARKPTTNDSTSSHGGGMRCRSNVPRDTATVPGERDGDRRIVDVS